MPANELSQQQYHKMTETPIPRLILSLAAPTILSMLITSIYNLADTFFVSRGLGNSPRWAFRLFNRPQVAVITLKKG